MVLGHLDNNMVYLHWYWQSMQYLFTKIRGGNTLNKNWKITQKHEQMKLSGQNISVVWSQLAAECNTGRGGLYEKSYASHESITFIHLAITNLLVHNIHQNDDGLIPAGGLSSPISVASLSAHCGSPVQLLALGDEGAKAKQIPGPAPISSRHSLQQIGLFRHTSWALLNQTAVTENMLGRSVYT